MKYSPKLSKDSEGVESESYIRIYVIQYTHPITLEDLV